jgi:hypothetical protein
MQQKSKATSSIVEYFLKPLVDHLGLNGAEALQRTRGSSDQARQPVDEDQLRRQGWSEADIAELRKQGQTNGSRR